MTVTFTRRLDPIGSGRWVVFEFDSATGDLNELYERSRWVDTF